jgi:hypothetical protein
VEIHLCLASKYDLWSVGRCDEVQPVSLTKDIVALSRDGLAVCLTGLDIEFLPLARDPRDLSDHGKPDRVV